MDPNKIIACLEGTINPSLQKEAESKLNEMYKISGFAPILLKMIMSEEVSMAVRQAAAIYMKNMCTNNWQKKDENIFHIHENDKITIRENIVEAIIHAPEILRNQLTAIVNTIIHEDYPERWPEIIDKISHNLQTDDPNTWMGALQTLYQLVKNYEYKPAEERQPLLRAMKVFLPALTRLFQQVINNNSAASVLLQKQCLKILYALVQYSLPMELFNEETLDNWMKFLQHHLETPPPEETLQVDVLERPELPWWKCKKWALHILTRFFERYGSPGNVTKEYATFSEFFLKRYTVGATHVLLKLLNDYRNQQYVSPRVLQQTLQFLEQGVSHAQTWKAMKDAFPDLLKDVIFPLMCFTDEDQEVWEDDPHEYIRMKFDVFEDFLSPASAAQCYLQSVCTKRKQTLQKTMTFCHGILLTTGANYSARRKDGALHIIGSLASTLLKRKPYKDQVEQMIMSHVVPEYRSNDGFMRARALWASQHFSEVRFKNDRNIINIVEGIKARLAEDDQLPVRMEAAFALQALMSDQEKAEKHCEPLIGNIIQNLLQLVHETENDDLTSVVQKVICLYCEQIIPFAVEITKNLVVTFMKMLSDKDGSEEGTIDDDDNADDKAVAAMGVLNTIETVLDTMEEEREITKQLEEIVTPIIAHVLRTRILDYYEEMFSLMHSLTCQAISPQMWEALPLIQAVFEDDGFDFFTEMMPVLHNFVTIDTKTFLSNPSYLEIIYSICKKVLLENAGEDPESHAAKLLEVIILQCKGQIDQCIPLLVETALARLTTEVKTSELRTMCLQVVIAAIYYNPPLLMNTLEVMKFPNTTESVAEQFFRQWLKDSDCFLGIHDRRVAILGLCSLIDLQNRPSTLTPDVVSQVLPALIVLFEGLKRAYRVRGDGESSSSSDSEDEDDKDDNDFNEELESSEDEIDEESAEYLEMLEKVGAKKSDDLDSEFDDEGETALEIYSSPLEDENNMVDEYTVFKRVLMSLQTRDKAWYDQLACVLTDDQRKAIQEIYVLADQRHAAAESKKIEKTGGYQFSTTNIPTNFNFSSGMPNTLSP